MRRKRLLVDTGLVVAGPSLNPNENSAMMKRRRHFTLAAITGCAALVIPLSVVLPSSATSGPGGGSSMSEVSSAPSSSGPPVGHCPMVSGPTTAISNNGQIVEESEPISWVICSTATSPSNDGIGSPVGNSGKRPSPPTANQGPSPLATDQGAICELFSEFTFTVGNSTANCYSGSGPFTNLGGPLYYLTNSSGYRAWLYQNADETGWADCFSHGDAYTMGSIDTNAQSLALGTSTSPCTTNGASSDCASLAPLAFTVGGYEGAPPTCYQGADTYTSLSEPFYFLVNGTGGRVWFHQYADGSGWADCFDNNGGYNIWGTQDSNPGNVQITTNASPY